MTFKDDEDDMPSRSSAEYVTRADHGKKEQRDRNAASKGDLLALQRSMLRGQVKPDATAKQVTQQDKEDAKTEEDAQRSADEEQKTPQGTKTLRQREEEQMQDADESDTASTLIDKAKQQAEIKKQSGEEYQQEMG